MSRSTPETPYRLALRALAMAYDREDAAQRGEPSPWSLDDVGDIGDSDLWVSDRLTCAEAAITAYISTITPAEAGGLVERLGERATAMEYLSPDFASACREAASLIQSQAARIAELEAGIRGLLDCPDIADNDHKDEETHAAERTARDLMNKETRG